MNLDGSIALPGGLFHFRVVVGIRLSEPVVVDTDSGAGEEEMIGYYRTYGVTAATPSAAVALVEELYADGPEAAQRDDPPGTVEEIELAVLDPMSMELPVDMGDLAMEGVHFESGRGFFTSDEEDPDSDAPGLSVQ